MNLAFKAPVKSIILASYYIYVIGIVSFIRRCLATLNYSKDLKNYKVQVMIDYKNKIK